MNVRKAGSPGNGIGVAQFGESLTSRGPVKIEREHRVAIGAVQVQIEKCEPQWTIEKKIPAFILIVVKELECAVKSGNLGELGFRSGFQIPQHKMFSMTRAVDLVVLVVRIFRRINSNEPSGDL